MPDVDTTPDATPADATEEAPYGFKADGTPRKRPYPARAVAAKKAAKEARLNNGNGNGNGHAPAQPAPALSPDDSRTFMARLVADLDEQIVELDRTLETAREQRQRISAARKALVA